MKKYIVKQNDNNDCGASCLLSIIKYYGGFVPLEIIKLDTLTTNKGTNFYNLKKAAERYGFEVYGYYKEEIKPPYIVQTLENGYYHFIVVYKNENNYYLCMDPAKGLVKMSSTEYNNISTGNVLKLLPINRIIKYKKNNYFFDNIKTYIKQEYLQIIIILLLSIMVILFSLINTYNLKSLITSYQKLPVFIILALSKNVLIYLKNILLAHLDKNNNIKIINNYLKHVFFLPSSYLQLKSSGEIISRINDLQSIKNLYIKELVNSFIYLFSFIIILILFYHLNYKLTIILIVVSIIYIIIYYLLNKKGFTNYLNYLDSESSLNNKLIEYINSLINIKNIHLENHFLSILKKDIKDNNIKSYSLDIYLNKLSVINNIFNDILLVLIFIYNYSNNLSNIIIIILLYGYYNECLTYFNSLLSNLSHFKSIIDRINGIYYIEEEKPLKGFKIGNIKIKNLGYKINNNIIFQNYYLTIKPKEKILIKGPNGIGKSTLLNIISKNITNYEGTITINNQDIRNLDIKKHLIYSSNKDILFKDTIINNIILNKKYHKNKFLTIIKLLYVEKIINKKNYKLNSIIDNNLSRGEEQIIILARNLYQDKEILLLDESLSEISYNLRNKIIYNINNYYKDKLIIYVSHNLENYSFDRIIKITARKEENA